MDDQCWHAKYYNRTTGEFSSADTSTIYRTRNDTGRRFLKFLKAIDSASEAAKMEYTKNAYGLLNSVFYEKIPMVSSYNRHYGIVEDFSHISTQRKSGAAKFFLIKIFYSACEIVFSGWTRSVRMDPHSAPWLELFALFSKYFLFK